MNMQYARAVGEHEDAHRTRPMPVSVTQLIGQSLRSCRSLQEPHAAEHASSRS